MMISKSTDFEKDSSIRFIEKIPVVFIIIRIAKIRVVNCQLFNDIVIIEHKNIIVVYLYETHVPAHDYQKSLHLCTKLPEY